MDRRTFAQGFALLLLAYQPKRDIPPEQHDLYDESWWNDVADLDGESWMKAVVWWRRNKAWMPKPSEMRAMAAEYAPRQAALPPPLPVLTVTSADIRATFNAARERAAAEREKR